MAEGVAGRDAAGRCGSAADAYMSEGTSIVTSSICPMPTTTVTSLVALRLTVSSDVAPDLHGIERTQNYVMSPCGSVYIVWSARIAVSDVGYANQSIAIFLSFQDIQAFVRASFA
jgi:hypothetical protein